MRFSLMTNSASLRRCDDDFVIGAEYQRASGRAGPGRAGPGPGDGVTAWP